MYATPSQCVLSASLLYGSKRKCKLYNQLGAALQDNSYTSVWVELSPLINASYAEWG